MATMAFNEFQRELQKRQIPDNIAYIMTLMYEQMIEVTKQGDAAAKIMLEMATTMENLTLLHQDTQQKVFEFRRSDRDDALIGVRSVANEPETEN
jgi:hypothetical protein